MRVDHVQTPHDAAAQDSDFEPESVMDEPYDDHEEGCVALLALADGAAAVTGFGPYNPTGLDEAGAAKAGTVLFRRHW